jgi:competence protein ComEC
VFALLFGTGMFRMEVSESQVSPLSSRIGETGVFEGRVVREPDVRESSVHLYVKEKETDALFLVTTNPFSTVSYGDMIEVRGTLEAPESFETDTGRTFNYPGYLRAKSVSEVVSFANVEVLETGGGNVIMRTLLQVKHAFMDALERSMSEPGVGLGEGMLLGVKRALGEELSETFRIVGIIHIVVLSGYNIMIVADFVMRILGHFFFPRTRLILGVMGIILFALMVGLSATVVRASIMAVLVLIARNSGRTYAVMRALALTGVLMLLHNPYLLAFDPGFQLSFLATLGLVLLSPQLEGRFTRVPEFIRGHLATTIGTQLFVLPILLFSMGALSIVSVLVNVLVLPAVPYAMFLTFVTGLFGLVSDTLGTIVGFGANLILTYIVYVAEFFATIPYAEVAIPAFPAIVVALLYTAIGLLTFHLTPATIPFKRNSGRDVTTRPTTNLKASALADETVINDYEGWVIEEEKDPSPRTHVRGDGSDPLPFR